MKNRIILSIVLTALSYVSYSQSISFSSGVGINTLFQMPDLERDYNDYYYSFSSGSNYFAKLDFNDIKGSALLSDFSIKIEKNSGTINEIIPLACYCGIGDFSGFYNSEPHMINNTILSIASYPLSIRLGKHIRVKSGFEFTKQLSNGFEVLNEDGTINKRESVSFARNDVEFKSYGLNGLLEIQIGRIQLNELVAIYPTYNAILGLTSEFKNLKGANAFRQNVGIGVEIGI